MTCISPCTPEEADNPIILHQEDVVERKDILIHRVDTDVLVVAAQLTQMFL